MTPNPAQIGKFLIFLGAMLVMIGLLIMGLSRLGWFRLPGDFEFGGKNWRVFLPITTCLLISLIVTIILWMIHYLKKK